MATITFYEKTGCAGNARQKSLLTASGHEVLARDLRHKAWTNLALLEFFIGLPVAQWFNPAAPAIKSGEIVPAELDEPTALALMRDNPLLIRRPLLQVGAERRVGFDATAIDAWIGLTDLPDENLEACRHDAAPHAGGCTP
ncbi:MAG: ArsC/Spx/MgsR family protein [Pseudomonadota bacterium]